MIKKSTLTLTIALSIIAPFKITTSNENSYPIKTSIFDKIKSEQYPSGCIVTTFPSGTVSCLRPDNSSIVRFSDGTTTEEFLHSYETSTTLLYGRIVEEHRVIPCKRYITTFPSGYRKVIQSPNENIFYYNSFGYQISKLPDEEVLYAKKITILAACQESNR